MKILLTLENWKEELIKNIGSSNMGNIRKILYNRKDLESLIIQETSFCNENTSIKIRLTYIEKNISKMNTCYECDKLINDAKSKYCSLSCNAKNLAKNPDVLKSKSESLIKSYSKKTEDEKNQIKVNRRNSLQEKYGVNHNFNIEGFKEHRKKTWFNNYGTEIAQQSDILKNKTRLTCEQRYGGPNPLSDPIIKAKWFASFKEKHNVLNPMHIDNLKRKMMSTKLGINIEDIVFTNELLLSIHDLTISQYYKLAWLFTCKSLSLHGKEKFGKNWRKERGKYAKHIDHMLSIRSGYLLKIDPQIIGHIENLSLISWFRNLSKGAKNSITIDELNNKINEYEQIKTD